MLGRAIGFEDTPASPKVAMVNQAFVRHFFPNQNPIGHRFSFGGQGSYEIVGVVGDAHFQDARGKQADVVFLSFLQDQTPDALRSEIELRTQGDPRGAVAAIRKRIAQVDPKLPITHVQSLSAQIDAKITIASAWPRASWVSSAVWRCFWLALVSMASWLRMLRVAGRKSASVWRWELSVQGFFGWSFVIRLYCYAGA